MASDDHAARVPGKTAALRPLGDRPLVLETPEHLLDEDTTPIERFFVRNNGLVPDEVADPDDWTLTIDGEVETPLVLTLGEIKRRFAARDYHFVLECAGNGRSGFDPPVEGNPWSNGGVGVARWTGVPLRDVLAEARLKPSAVYTAHYGADSHVSGEAGRVSISRGVRIEKAMDAHTLLAFAMNGRPLPRIHGGPLRLIVPGWAGSASHKWLTRIWIRDREHDGSGMTGTSYRVPARPMAPGEDASGVEMRVLEAMPVRSIITHPAAGERIPAGTRAIEVRGAAWAGEADVRAVEVSVDFGRVWHRAELAPPRNRYDWSRWRTLVLVPSEGSFEIWARATDSEHRAQPLVVDNWNPGGYAGNSVHRLAVTVG